MRGKAARDGFAVLLAICFVLIIVIGVGSGHYRFAASAPTFANGFQMHTEIVYGTWRVNWGTASTLWSGLPAGVKFETLDEWRWYWGLDLSVTRLVGIVQIPFWFVALLLLAWIVVRRARRATRLAQGLCPYCGKASGGTDRCPKCKRLLPQRHAALR